jgi:S-adenosylmethionine:tRNA ribosyltransferase-isomerase
MSAVGRMDRQFPKLMVAEADGALLHLPRAALMSMFRPGDLVVANDAATLPASLMGVHRKSGAPIEVRLAGWVAFRDPTRFVAIAFGAGDHRMRTEDRPPPPPLSAGDRLEFGPLAATVECVLDHPRLLRIRFAGHRETILQGLAWRGRPIQYAHAPEPFELWDVWTKIAADPIAFEPPSAGFALDWRILAAWRERGVRFATLSHAAGLSSTGDPALDQRLPFDEFYLISEACASAVHHAKLGHGRVIAIGTSVVRALEAVAHVGGTVRAGMGLARGRIARGAPLRIVDAILTGVHQPGESHYELLRAFADESALDRIRAAAGERGYRAHEFDDSLLIERQGGASWRTPLLSLPEDRSAASPPPLWDLAGEDQGGRSCRLRGQANGDAFHSLVGPRDPPPLPHKRGRVR